MSVPVQLHESKTALRLAALRLCLAELEHIEAGRLDLAFVRDVIRTARRALKEDR